MGEVLAFMHRHVRVAIVGILLVLASFLIAIIMGAAFAP